MGGGPYFQQFFKLIKPLPQQKIPPLNQTVADLSCYDLILPCELILNFWDEIFILQEFLKSWKIIHPCIMRCSLVLLLKNRIN